MEPAELVARAYHAAYDADREGREWGEVPEDVRAQMVACVHTIRAREHVDVTVLPEGYWFDWWRRQSHVPAVELSAEVAEWLQG